jgi:hypothetical protein
MINSQWQDTGTENQWTIIPRLAFLGRFGAVNAGLIYRMYNRA